MNIKSAYYLWSLLLVFTLAACEDDDGGTTGSTMGSVTIEMTDAPIDDANVQAAFVTITDIKADGRSLDGFSKTTVELTALTNGKTESLGNFDVETGAYSSLSLVLDYTSDENGNAPGCYIMDTDGMTHALVSSSNEIQLTKNYDVGESQTTNLVVDFDLRKTIQYEQSGADKYDFVTKAELESGIRVVNKSRTGVIVGNCEDVVTTSDKIIVYAYKKGEYDRNTEIQGQGMGNVRFSNAEASATVAGNGDYELHFLEEGDYEIHFASFEDTDDDGELELKGTLLVDVISTIDLGSISVGANATITADVLITGLLEI